MDTPSSASHREVGLRHVVLTAAVLGIIAGSVGFLLSISELLRNFHDDQAVYLFPRTGWWFTVAVLSGVTLAIWRTERGRSTVVVAAIWLVTVVAAAAALRGAYLLLVPLDIGRYEAYCQPLVFETVGRQPRLDRCTDSGRFTAAGLLFVGGVLAAVLVWVSAWRVPARFRRSWRVSNRLPKRPSWRR